jgi:hypothetical protein
MNFQQCLSASVRRGDVTEDYEEQILSISWPGRGVYDDKTVVCGSHMAQVYYLILFVWYFRSREFQCRLFDKEMIQIKFMKTSVAAFLQLPCVSNIYYACRHLEPALSITIRALSS